MTYYDNQESIANIYVGLVKRGWNCFGYRPDQSDSMTDYYSPARWDGIAEKDGYVLLVDVYGTSDSGKNGYPTFQHANPKRCNWHIEKDGEIIAQGNGAFKCTGYLFSQYEKETMEKVNKFIDRIEKNIKPAKKVESVKTSVVVVNNSNNENVEVEMNLNNDLNGVELKFSGVPSEATRQLLKENGFKWSKYNKVWYAKQSTKTIMFAEALVSTLNDTFEEVEETPVQEQNEAETVQEMAVNEEILINDSDLIGRKVFGQWGIGAGWNYGIITGETIYNEVIIKWEDEENILSEQYFNIKDLVFVHENTNLSAIGVYLMPIENNEPSEVVTAEPIEQTETTIQEFTPEYTNDNKIKVQSIKFIWSESSYIADNTTVKTFVEAEQLIKNAAFHAPDNGCYDKTKFLITWSDGQIYEGRIDIVKIYSFKTSPLKDHIVSFAEHVIYDNEGWHTQEDKDSYKTFLNTYTLEDEKQHISQNKQSGKVLDFSSKFKAKQEQKETEEMSNHFINNVLPYMEPEEINDLQKAYSSKDESQLNQTWQKLMLITAVRRAKDDILKQN